MSDFPEDAERLPEGFKRIAYDSDSAKFTFRDRNGQLYQGEAGEEYGILTPMSVSCSRPSAFSSDSSSIPPPRRSTHCKQNEGKTFEDFLPSNFITSTTTSLGPSTGTVNPLKTRIKTVRRTLYNLRRSVTSIHRPRPKLPEMRESERDETRGLVRRDSSSESSSIARRSKTMPTRPRSKYPSS